MILQDVEHQIVNEYDQSGIHYLICKDYDKREIQKYMVVRSSKDRAFWSVIPKGQPIRDHKPVYRDTISKIFKILSKEAD